AQAMVASPGNRPMRIFHDRRPDRRRTVGALAALWLERVEALADAPAIIAPVLDPVHHLPEVLTHVAGPQLAALAVQTEFPDVPQADGPDLGRPVQILGVALPGVVLGDTIELAPLRVIDVDPEDRGKPVARVLPGRQGIVRGAAVAQRDIQEAVRP